MSNFEVYGFDKLEKKLKQMENAAKEMDGVNEYSFEELFPPAFMRKYTSMQTIEEFLDNCGFPANTNEEFEAIPEDDFDIYVRDKTSFSSWENMQEKSAEELIKRRLGFD